LRQIVLNLLTNAIKYTPAGGRVSLSAHRDGSTAVLQVSDTGIGIPADQLPRVFEPFYQVERGTTRRFPGIGLGLAIARELAHAMRGELTLDSVVDQGTRATLTLPAVERAVVPAMPAASAAAVAPRG
jgi:signal transduction histidine kinase